MIGVRNPAGLEIYIFDTLSRLALGPTQTLIQWVGTRGYFPGSKAAEA